MTRPRLLATLAAVIATAGVLAWVIRFGVPPLSSMPPRAIAVAAALGVSLAVIVALVKKTKRRP